MINPVLYMVNAFRYGIASISDINIIWAFTMVGLFSVVLFFVALNLLEKFTGAQLMADYRDTELGRDTVYSDQYDASLLYPIPRSKARDGEAGAPPFSGVDLWTAFEISWLSRDGLPQVAIGEFIFPVPVRPLSNPNPSSSISIPLTRASLALWRRSQNCCEQISLPPRNLMWK